MRKTQEQLHQRLTAFVAAQGSQARAAEALKVSRQYLNDVLHGRREMGPAIYGGLGFTREVGYRSKEEGGEE